MLKQGYHFFTDSKERFINCPAQQYPAKILVTRDDRSLPKNLIPVKRDD